MSCQSFRKDGAKLVKKNDICKKNQKIILKKSTYAIRTCRNLRVVDIFPHFADYPKLEQLTGPEHT